MFADDDGNDIAIAEPEVSSADTSEPEIEEIDSHKAPEGTMVWPGFIRDIDGIYRANRSHVFALYGNVYDYPDNTGVRGDLRMTLFTRYDAYWLKDRLALEAKNSGGKVPKALAQPVLINNISPVNIAASFSIRGGLQFATKESLESFCSVMSTEIKDFKAESAATPDIGSTMALLDEWFRISARRFAQNQPLRVQLTAPKLAPSKRAEIVKQLSSLPEYNLTVVLYDARMCFPRGDLGSQVGDRTPVAVLENWALDGSIACRNKIVLVTPRIADLQESIRSGDSRVSSIRIQRPNLADRREWIANFRNYIATTPAMVNQKPRTDIDLAEDLTVDILANNTAGMSRVQIEGVFMESWLHDVPVDITMVAGAKKKALEAEYGDILDVKQADIASLVPAAKGKPEEVQREIVWSYLGGHDQLKRYAEDWVIDPMILGDRRRTSRGFLLNGPPGTGKSYFAELLAILCRVNFIKADFSKLFGGIVGETETKTERFFDAIDAMAPCIVFCDEIDSVFSGGRQSAGDSGVQARMFNKVMQWLSDDARWGKVVVVMASNRPDLLDSAFIREGRVDDRLVALPPHPTDSRARKGLLEAVCRKSGIRMNKSLASTLSTRDQGLGRLIADSRIWTGAEYERLVKLAFGNAAQRATTAAREAAKAQGLNRRETLDYLREATGNPLINLEDWERAMAAYRPNTRQADRQIDLALEFCNNLEYVPPQWRSRYDEVVKQASSQSEAVADYSSAAAYERD